MNRKVVISLLASLSAGAAHAGQTGFYYKSEPGDPMGNGYEAFYTDTQQNILVGPLYGPGGWTNTVTGQIGHPGDDLTSYLISSTTGIHLWFEAPGGADLTPGDYPFSSWYSLWDTPVFWRDREPTGSCTQVSGTFSVKEAVYDYANEALTSFAADFVQRCEGSTAASRGYLRFNSEVPFPENMPPSIASAATLNRRGCIEATRPDGATVALHVVNSDSTDWYSWTAQFLELASLTPTPPPSSCGAFLCLSSSSLSAPTSSQLSLYAPTSPRHAVVTRVIPGAGENFAFDMAIGETAKVSLNATDVNGEVHEAVMKACVLDTTPPEIEIVSPQEGEAIVGNSFFLDIKVTDAVDQEPTFRYVTVDRQIVELDPKKPTLVKLPRLEPGSDPKPIRIEVSAKDDYANTSKASIVIYQHHDMRSKK